MHKLILAAAAVYGDYCFSEPGGVRIRVALDGNKVNVNAITTTQWVGVGIPKSADFDEMGLGNFVIGGGNNIYDRMLSVDQNGRPDKDLQHTISGSSSITTANGVTNMSFSRLLAPAGANQINPGKARFLWAGGSINTAQNGFLGVNYHANHRGSFVADLNSAGNCPPVAAPASSSSSVPALVPPQASRTTNTTMNNGAGSTNNTFNWTDISFSNATDNTSILQLPPEPPVGPPTNSFYALASTNTPPPSAGVVGKVGKAGKAKSAKAKAKAKAKALPECVEGQQRCTVEMQRKGMNCILDACVRATTAPLSECAEGQQRCTVELQRKGMNCIVDSCVRASSSSAGGNMAATGSAGAYCFSTPEGVRVHVELDGDKVHVNAISNSQWVGVGIPRSTHYDEMPNADFVIGGGNAIYERTLTVAYMNGRPDREVKHVIPGTATVSTVNGVTNMSFSRLLAPEGRNVIDSTKPLFLWAAGSINSNLNGFAAINYHEHNRGSFPADFKNGNCPSVVGAKAAPSSEATTVTVSRFVPYPDTKYAVAGSVIAKFVGTSVSFQYDLRNVDPRCTQTTSAANSCGLHIHVGKTCSNNTEIAGHFFALPADPWTNASYKSDNRGNAQGVVTVEYGANFSASAGRSVIVHDQNGTRMSCALIPLVAAVSGTNGSSVAPVAPSDTVVTVGNFFPYPGTGTRFNVGGSVVMKFSGTSVNMDYHLQNADGKCVRSIDVPNSCGLHIHVGKSCSNATEIGGHYYDNSTGVDPWLAAMYISNDKGVANGATSVTYGYNYSLSAGRSVIVHDQNGTRMACALIPQGGQISG